jgi:hypothetical protein
MSFRFFALTALLAVTAASTAVHAQIKQPQQKSAAKAAVTQAAAKPAGAQQ